MYSNLRNELIRKDITQVELAATLGVTTMTIHRKLNGRSEFKLSEIETIRDKYFRDADADFIFKFLFKNFKGDTK